jgi:hypothetical protein
LVIRGFHKQYSGVVGRPALVKAMKNNRLRKLVDFVYSVPLLFLAGLAQAGNVFVTEYEYQADLTVLPVEYEYQADLNVLVVDYGTRPTARTGSGTTATTSTRPMSWCTSASTSTRRI